MKATGIVRKLDRLGRCVLPIELRNSLELATGTEMEILVGEDSVILQKYERHCVFCKETQDLKTFKGHFICPNCLKSIAE